jgi:hypothetical protein
MWTKGLASLSLVRCFHNFAADPLPLTQSGSWVVSAFAVAYLERAQLAEMTIGDVSMSQYNNKSCPFCVGATSSGARTYYE